jgi:hypothetical protein
MKAPFVSIVDGEVLYQEVSALGLAYRRFSTSRDVIESGRVRVCSAPVAAHLGPLREQDRTW